MLTLQQAHPPELDSLCNCALQCARDLPLMPHQNQLSSLWREKKADRLVCRQFILSKREPWGEFDHVPNL